ncbi:ATP-dependent DNA helicase MER3 [Operophtera brumata]|uniref:ATP-dependent DNA helicase MER3 n=1 Tax=Operophtera brumata TaxID=104452 RepID=A0A0L7LIE4_OPEBR|nr:ATP-dependent DNA helicase MER3 [Operophtera brumata]
MVVCAPTGSGKTVVFEMAIVQLLMQLEDINENQDFKIIYKWYAKFTKLGLQCIAVTGDTDVDFLQLKPYRQMVEVIKLFLIDEVHILNDETRGPVLEAVVSRMKTIEVLLRIPTHNGILVQYSLSRRRRKFGDECRPVRLRRVVEGYHCAENTSIFKFDLNW